MTTGERRIGVVELFRNTQRLARNLARDLARGYTDKDVAEASCIISGGIITAKQRDSYMNRRFERVSGPPSMLPMGPIAPGLLPEVRVNVQAITAEQQRLLGLTPLQLDGEVRAEAFDRARGFKINC